MMFDQNSHHISNINEIAFFIKKNVPGLIIEELHTNDYEKYIIELDHIFMNINLYYNGCVFIHFDKVVHTINNEKKNEIIEFLEKIFSLFKKERK